MELPDLNNLIQKHTETTNPRFKKILEEFFYLCLNESFLSTLEEIKEQIKSKSDVLDQECIFPFTSIEAVGFFRKTIKEKSLWRWYWTLIRNMNYKHNLFHHSFTESYIDESVIESENSQSIDSFKKINLLENMIFFSDPFPDHVQELPFNPRSGQIEMDEDATGPYVKIRFDVGTERFTMVHLIEKEFDNIRNIQNELYNVPIKTHYIEKHLQRKYRTYQLHQQGKTYSKQTIALEVEGLLPKGSSIETPRTTIKEMKKKIERFNSDS